MRHRLLLVLFAFCIASPAAARAQDLLTEVPPKRMIKILTSMGLEVQEPKTIEGKNTAIKFELGGYKVVMFVAKDHSDAQLFMGFTDRQISLEKMNEWNRDHRFIRGYLDRDDDPVLESDIDFTGGVTEANIKAWIKIFRGATNAYAKFLQTNVSQR